MQLKNTPRRKNLCLCINTLSKCVLELRVVLYGFNPSLIGNHKARNIEMFPLNKNYLFVIVLHFFIILSPGLCLSQAETCVVRPPAVAGKFYPASQTALRKQISGFLDDVPEKRPGGKILAAVAPHAGYTYSGAVAAHTHKFLSAVDFDTLVIIGHDTHLNEVAFTSPADFFETPLGKFPLDKDMISKMQAFHPGMYRFELVER